MGCAPHSSPPIPEISGAAISHDDLVLESADGTRFAAFSATPDEPSGIGIVILPDVRGLYRFYEELALRFAERGYAALAIDYFGRTAGGGKRSDDFEYMSHVEQTTPGGGPQDRAAARGRPRRGGRGSPGRSGSTGGRGPAATDRPGRRSGRESLRRRSSGWWEVTIRESPSKK